ncbi:hypothetical protein PR202_gb21444 [Eleusine coracana subsp. coracana]|uniref:Uncharacterized protein n=1 Tax=Eleusine coracana subsp. coracana TaxID=191504 RepID=A0AAV5FE54_ELECO|nr:hypothetical protein PR202_gb21444 [Eleusine coracana subsp. coracana]
MLGGKNTRDGRPPDSGKPIRIRRDQNKYAFATAALSSATPLSLGYGEYQPTRATLSCPALSRSPPSSAHSRPRRRVASSATAAPSSSPPPRSSPVRSPVGGPAAALFTAGALCCNVPAYVAELSPRSTRGALASHPDGLLYLGSILGSLCCNVLKPKLPPRATWQVVMISVASRAAGPALLGSVVLLLPDSPRWLVATDRASEARRVIAATSATLEEAQLRFLEINDELISVEGRSWWSRTEEWRELAARPTEPLRRAVVTALVAKLFQQASVAQYVYRDAGAQVVPRALAAFGFVAVLSLSASLVVVELGLQLVTAALNGGGCCRLSRLAPSDRLTRRQEELKWTRGLSATMLLSLMALAWVALGPARWADDAWCPTWMSSTAVNTAVSSAILALFVRVYEFSAAYGGRPDGVPCGCRARLALLLCLPAWRDEEVTDRHMAIPCYIWYAQYVQ